MIEVNGEELYTIQEMIDKMGVERYTNLAKEVSHLIHNAQKKWCFSLWYDRKWQHQLGECLIPDKYFSAIQNFLIGFGAHFERLGEAEIVDTVLIYNVAESPKIGSISRILTYNVCFSISFNICESVFLYNQELIHDASGTSRKVAAMLMAAASARFAIEMREMELRILSYSGYSFKQWKLLLLPPTIRVPENFFWGSDEAPEEEEE